ncbi:MAG: CAP domain-containing protein, partial [Gemmatimonadaceae bacterium]
PTPVRPAPTARVVIAPKAPAPPPPPPPPSPPPPPAAPAPSGLDTSPMTALEQALFNDTNARRLANGLAALTVNPALVGLARVRSHDMADHNYFAHTSPVTGDTAFSLMDRYGVPYGWAGENLAKNNYPGAQCEAVAADALWNSPPHRENILGAHYTQMGVGFAVDGSGMAYFTVIFDGPA